MAVDAAQGGVSVGGGDRGAALTLVRTTNHGQRHMCSACGACLTIVYDSQPDTIWPAAGSFHDSSLPLTLNAMSDLLYRVIHICCIWKQAWYDLPEDGLPRIKYAG